ncbi:MAG: hypothetical protein M3512_04230 [Bacteroidota bacterium]|nr:hypothetical protein [Bacteroidota bacterium]
MISFSFVANTCAQRISVDNFSNTYWKHSYEEDQGDTLMFRPKDYDFPPSRGREGFEFKEEGVFYKYVIAPADGIDTLEGKWEKSDQNNLYNIVAGSKSNISHMGQHKFKIEILDYNKKERALKIRQFEIDE